MADTFDPDLKIRLPQTGSYEDTWGAVVNSDSLGLLAKAIAGRATITLTGLAYSMPALSNGSASDSRMAILRFIGSPAGPVTVTLPGSVTSKVYMVDNRCGQSITFTYGGGATAAIANGVVGFILCDGTDVISTGGGVTNADTLGGIAAALYARRDVSNVFLKVNSYPWITVVEAPSTVIDATAGNHQRLTLTGDRTMATPTGPVDGQPLVLQVRQDAVGGRHITAWDMAFMFEGGVAPTLGGTANSVDLFVGFYDVGLAKWIMGHFASIATASGASFSLTFDSNQSDINLGALLGTVGAAAVVNITVTQGTVLQALSAGSFALDLYNVLPIGSTVNLTNLGYILGHGGDAGNGAELHDQGSGLGHGNRTAGYDGSAGGAAIRGPGPGITFNITNGFGHMWGGGGGGGGGGATLPGTGQANGGGGGGGAGGGFGAKGGRAGQAFYGNDGVYGSTGVTGAAGAGASGASSGGTGGTGGNGGTWGAAGAAGTDNTPGAGGAAGKAIDLAGGTASFISGNGSPNVMGSVT